jgi:hypothetical protein
MSADPESNNFARVVKICFLGYTAVLLALLVFTVVMDCLDAKNVEMPPLSDQAYIRESNEQIRSRLKSEKLISSVRGSVIIWGGLWGVLAVPMFAIYVSSARRE